VKNSVTSDSLTCQGSPRNRTTDPASVASLPLEFPVAAGDGERGGEAAALLSARIEYAVWNECPDY
jgi:hypothetical protein